MLSGELRARVGGANLEVLLDESGGGGGGRWLRSCDRAEAEDVENDDGDSGEGEDGAREAALAKTNADEPESVYGGDDEGEAVGSGDRGEASQQRVVDLSDTENIPRQTGDAGSGEFDGDPGEWHENERGLPAESTMECDDEGCEERMIEAEVKAEENEDTGGNWLLKGAVEVHGLVDPITVAQVPDEAAKVAQDRSLSDGKWIFCLILSEKRPEQRQERDPADCSAPKWSRSRDGKR